MKTFGPHESFDPETGEPVYIYSAEAWGTDGRYHGASVRGSATAFVEFQTSFRDMVGEILKNRMKEEGVWDDAEEAVVR